MREILGTIEEVLLDVGIRRFNSRGFPVTKVSYFLFPRINKPGSKREPSFFNIFNELRIVSGAEFFEI